MNFLVPAGTRRHLAAAVARRLQPSLLGAIASRGTMRVARELLPLPCPYPGVLPPADRPGQRRGASCIIRVEAAQQVWCNEAVGAINGLGRSGSFNAFTHRPLAGQLASLEHVVSVVQAAGRPSCAPAEAHRELCGARAGYEGPAQRARYQRDLVSLPEEGGLVDGAQCLSGEAREYWCRWQERIMQRHAAGAVATSVPDELWVSSPTLTGSTCSSRDSLSALSRTAWHV